MKKTIALFTVAILASISVYSQTASHVQHMIITVYEDYGLAGKSKIIQTREDGSQDILDIKWKAPYTLDRYADHEDSLMLALKPFFDQGWELVSSNLCQSPTNTSLGLFVTRYFFRKEQQ